jgi:phosphate starvation-inducible PhoH-like protein
LSATVLENVITLGQGEVLEFCGNNDEKIRALQKHLDARIILRGNTLKILGAPDDVRRTTHVIEEILQVMRKRGRLTEQQFRRALNYAAERARSGLPPSPSHGGPVGDDVAAPTDGADGPKLSDLLLEEIPVPLKRRRLTPLTGNQKLYVNAIRNNTVAFGVGPAGTGKTYLAMAMAVGALVEGSVSRIILCRPAVEAGERLGFLPGDLAQKFDPYVRPLWDALYEMMESERIKTALETGVIEIAPLAYMRGRTLNNAFVILDEGQNTTIEQMKMFLTRLGFESKAVITGDVTQVDLPHGQTSGLVHASRVLEGIPDIAIVRFEGRDVVRHPLLTKIIHAYEREKQEERERLARREAEREHGPRAHAGEERATAFPAGAH